eukprot:gene22762-31052_t
MAMMTEIEIGSLCLVREPSAKIWDVAHLKRIIGTCGDRTCEVSLQDTSKLVMLPYIPACVQSLDQKRERKVKFDSYSENNFYHFPFEKKNKKSAKTLAASSSETKTETIEEVEKEKKEVKRTKRSKASTTSEEIKDAEVLSENSLSRYLSAMQPFLSARVYKRMLHYATTDGSTPYVTGPRGKSAADSKFTPVKAPISESGAEEIAAVTQPTERKNVELRDYQLAGVAWLVDRYEKGLHCILADEMGLGKTLQTITFIAHLKYVKKLNGPFLVVVPLSVMFNWMSECKKFFSSYDYSTGKAVKEIQQKLHSAEDFDVCITSYEMIKSNLQVSIPHSLLK